MNKILCSTDMEGVTYSIIQIEVEIIPYLFKKHEQFYVIVTKDG